MDKIEIWCSSFAFFALGSVTRQYTQLRDEIFCSLIRLKENIFNWVLRNAPSYFNLWTVRKVNSNLLLILVGLFSFKSYLPNDQINN